MAGDAERIEEQVDDAINRTAQRVAAESVDRGAQLSDAINTGAAQVGWKNHPGGLAP